MTRTQCLVLVAFLACLAAFVMLAGLIDVWLAGTAPDQTHTISWAMALWARENPLGPMAFCLVVGAVVGGLAVHFFGWRTLRPSEWARIATAERERDLARAENVMLRKQLEEAL